MFVVICSYCLFSDVVNTRTHRSLVHFHYRDVHVTRNLCVDHMHADFYVWTAVNVHDALACTDVSTYQSRPKTPECFYSTFLKYLQQKSALGVVRHTAALVNDIRAGFKKENPLHMLPRRRHRANMMMHVRISATQFLCWLSQSRKTAAAVFEKGPRD